MSRKSITCLIVFLCMLIVGGKLRIQHAMAQEMPSDPVISLTAKNEPLADALDAIGRQTGYQFNLTPQWEDYPVNATINNLPLEQGLKRLLRSLNHTILWEADNVVTIKVYGRVTPGSSGGISFTAPPQDYPEENEPPIEPDNELQDENDERLETDNDSQPDALDEPDLENETAADERPQTSGRRPSASAVEE